jgi:integrase/recombinase XerD
MRKHNPENERIKRRYFLYIKEAEGQSEQTVDAIAKALDRFEVYTKHKNFKAFHYQQAVAFKKNLAEQKAERSRKPLSKATLSSTLSALKKFFKWLAWQPGYKSRLHHPDAEYFNLSEKDSRVAKARREKPVPTIEQIKHVIATMPTGSEIELRNRALIAFTLLTGARDSAIASMKLKHIDLITGCVHQDACEVNTKFSKTFTTYFFPVGDEICQIVTDWVTYLRRELLWSNDDPLFPATLVTLGSEQRFEADGLKREHWSTTSPIRSIFRTAFTNAELPYFNPHSFRNTLVLHGETVCQTPESFKAWSQNLGHEAVLTTFFSYGEVSNRRQGEIIQSLASPRTTKLSEIERTLQVAARQLRDVQT